jgi:hypothetical protein
MRSNRMRRLLVPPASQSIAILHNTAIDKRVCTVYGVAAAELSQIINITVADK